MSVQSPRITRPPFDDIAARTARLAKKLSPWAPPDGQADLGSALIHVFDRMARHVLERLNSVPDRSFLSFLNLLGVEPTPPRPARAPLTFTLVTGGAAEPIIPAGTGVGVEPQPSDPRDLRYETTRELATTRASLTAVYVRQPDGDRWADRTAAATSAAPTYFEAFGSRSRAPAQGGEPAAEHALYVGANDILSLMPGVTVQITLTLASVADAQAWSALLSGPGLPALATDPYYSTITLDAPLMRWSYWNGAAWAQLSPSVALGGATVILTFSLPADMASTIINGYSSRYLRAHLIAWPRAAIPRVQRIDVGASVFRQGLRPDMALFNGAPVDLSRDILPLGERPRTTDTFYLSFAEAFSKGNANVTINVTRSSRALATLKASNKPKLAWDVSGPGTWISRAETNPTTQSVLNGDTGSGGLGFAIPVNAAPIEVGGISAYWVRIRLVSGNFGDGVRLETRSANDPMNPTSTITTLVDENWPPTLESITVTYTYAPTNRNPRLFSSNYRELREHSNAAPFDPFVRRADDAALYLGFDRPFANRNTLLYFQIAPLTISEAQVDASALPPPSVVWEYSTAQGWAPLGADDETRSFSQSGLLQFIGPADFGATALFGRSLFWLRARVASGSFVVAPRVGRVLTNTVWGTEVSTIRLEILGGSNGEAGQAFTLSHRPVLDGQVIEVREPEPPPDAERIELERAQGPGAVQIVDDPGRAPQIWVRWVEVPDFYSSGQRDRHYRIDRRAGVIQFGDGQRGMIPPRDARNVRATLYSTGGGAAGNKPAGAITQLKTSIAYVDSVVNYEPATGGADEESLESVQDRAPRRLRHGERAVTAEDFEDLAREASAAVARAIAITPTFAPTVLAEDLTSPVARAGKVIVVIVPKSDATPPTSSVSLFQDVQAYIRARSATAVDLSVIGPDWIGVNTSVVIVPKSREGVEALVLRVKRAIAGFLHPLTGGADGDGWAFGQRPNESDIFRLLGSISGVDLAHAVTISFVEPAGVRAAQALIYSGDHAVTILA